MEQEVKVCRHCCLTLPKTDEFYHRRGDNRPEQFKSICKKCRYSQLKGYRKNNAEKIRERMRAYHEKNRDKLVDRHKKRTQEVRSAALAAYGNMCVCCNETTKEFLAIDHVNNDGYLHRRQEKISGSGIYWWLKKNNYPTDGRFQILCHNCNVAKALYGSCPHNKGRLGK